MLSTLLYSLGLNPGKLAIAFTAPVLGSITMAQPEKICQLSAIFFNSCSAKY